MQSKTLFRLQPAGVSALGMCALALASISLTGCGVGITNQAAAPVSIAGIPMSGSVFGGQQPIAGSSVQIYAASAGGYGASSYALLTTPVATDTNGRFSITGKYTCPSANSQVYLVATGGNPGAGTNSAVAEMAALGACGNLSASTFVSMNEVTTVASVYALAPFMTGYANVGSSSTNVQGLTNAFATVNRLANIGTGSSTGTLPTNATGPTTKVNTLANILAACINSTGPSSAPCNTLFTKAVSASGTAPTDTVGAALNIARLPGQNVAAILALNTPVAPFQPSLSSANDFTLAIKYKQSINTPSAAAVNAAGDLWVANKGDNSLTILNASTGAASAISSTIYLAAPSGIAFDAAGNAWISNLSNYSGDSRGQLTVANPSGTFANGTFTSSGLSGVAVNGAGQVVASIPGANGVVIVTPNGTVPGTVNTYSAGGASAPVAVAINPN